MVNFSFPVIQNFIEKEKKKKKEQALQPLATLAAIVEASRSKATEQY